MLTGAHQRFNSHPFVDSCKLPDSYCLTVPELIWTGFKRYFSKDPGIGSKPSALYSLDRELSASKPSRFAVPYVVKDRALERP
ncbi:hypothetical protein WG66_000386 [Moniliophthora roreri]|nr:hypothetical protein WG66_000386 [Moniliophthora roreri]